MSWIQRVLVGVIIAILVSLCGGRAQAENSTTWSQGDPVRISKIDSRGERQSIPYCGGDIARIRLAHEQTDRTSCLYGEEGGMRVARYVNSQGRPEIAIAGASDVEFYVLRGVCEDRSACVYSQVSDALYVGKTVEVGTSQVIKIPNISTRILRVFDSSIRGYYYTLKDLQLESLSGVIHTYTAVDNIAISKNGRWLALEYGDKGLIRLDALTGETRRVMTYDSTAPGYDMAISNDGQSIALASQGSGSYVVSINETCGDYLTSESAARFESYIHPCYKGVIDTSLYDQFFSTEAPYFLDNDRLYYSVSTRVGTYDTLYAPHGTALDAAVTYVALGDSFTSGEGETDEAQYRDGTNEPPHMCHTSQRSYPYLVALKLRQSIVDSLNIACSGAVMTDIVGGGTYKGQGGRVSDTYDQLYEDALANGRPGVAPQRDFVKNTQPDVVTIGVGGNDAGFMDKLKSCILPGTCDWAKTGEGRYAVAAEIGALEDRYVNLFKKVKEVSPTTELYAVGYPDVISDENDSCGGLVDIFITNEERLFIRYAIQRINDVMKAAAQRADIRYIDVEGSYTGHEICGDAKPMAMNLLRFGDDMSPVSALPSLKIIGAESFHPTPFGHQRVADTVADALYLDTPAHLMRGASSAMRNEEYWSGEVSDKDAVARYLRLSSPDSLIRTSESTYRMSTPSRYFEPDSTVQIVVDGVQYAEARASHEGSLSATVFVKKTPSIQTIFFYGTTPSGERIGVYSSTEHAVQVAGKLKEAGKEVGSADTGQENDHSASARKVIDVGRDAPVDDGLVGTLPSSIPSTIPVVSMPSHKKSTTVSTAGTLARDQSSRTSWPFFVVTAGLLVAGGSLCTWAIYRYTKRRREKEGIMKE